MEFREKDFRYFNGNVAFRIFAGRYGDVPCLAKQKFTGNLSGQESNMKLACLSKMKGEEMREIKLLSLKLRNFKGISELSLDFQGKSTDIYADNRVGKTTIADAFFWLFSNKDSAGRADFDVKPLGGPLGEAVHGLESEVEAVLRLDTLGSKGKFRKVLAEDWTKKRGSSTPVFTGHTVSYFIDDVPKKLKEFNEAVASIVDEKLFRILSSGASLFALKKEDRRRMLLETFGDKTDQDVFSSNDELASLPGILNGKKVDDYRAILKSQRTKANDEIDKIPVRISEQQRTVADIVVAETIAELKAEGDKQGKTLAELQAKLAIIQAGGEVAEKTKILREAEGKISAAKTKANEAASSGVLLLMDKRQKLHSELAANNTAIAGIISTEDDLNRALTSARAAMDDLRKAWIDIDEMVFSGSETSCPTCGQDMPTSIRDAVRDKFNIAKAKKLEVINDAGLAEKEKAEKAFSALTQISIKLGEAQSVAACLKEKISAVEKEIADAQAGANKTDYESEPEYKKLVSDHDRLLIEIGELKADNVPAMAKVNAEIFSAQEAKKEIDQKIAQHGQIEKAADRVEELKVEERVLAAQLEKIDSELHLIELFIKTKVDLVENDINSHFRMIRWKMFDVQINGGIAECCEALVDGVPYSTNLNTGARINAGLDAVNAFSERHQIRLPLFVDNCESVTALMPIDNQVIRLIVSEPDKKLRIEVRG